MLTPAPAKQPQALPERLLPPAPSSHGLATPASAPRRALEGWRNVAAARLLARAPAQPQLGHGGGGRYAAAANARPAPWHQAPIMAQA
jgi:hypothetical protein